MNPLKLKFEKYWNNKFLFPLQRAKIRYFLHKILSEFLLQLIVQLKNVNLQCKATVKYYTAQLLLASYISHKISLSHMPHSNHVELPSWKTITLTLNQPVMKNTWHAL